MTQIKHKANTETSQTWCGIPLKDKPILVASFDQVTCVPCRQFGDDR